MTSDVIDELREMAATYPAGIGLRDARIAELERQLHEAHEEVIRLRAALAYATDDDMMTDIVQEALADLGRSDRLTTGETLRVFCGRKNSEIIDALRARFMQATVGVGMAGLEGENTRMRAAITRYLDLNSSCDYVDGEPDVCPGVAEIGGMCHWCELRAAVGE